MRLFLLLLACAHSLELPPATPSEAGLDPGKLSEMTRWIRDQRPPIFSLLISRHGKLVYELYTWGDRDDAHYLMSVTKSVLSTLVGAAADRGLIALDAPLSQLLPRSLFAGDPERFSAVTLREVMGMAALDSPDPPRVKTPEALARQHAFLNSPNRVAFALTRPLLTVPFQYNDVAPMIASGVLAYRCGKSPLEFAEEALFKPLGFRNYEWMHQDPSGNDNGGYGLRLRPIDMQKLGILYLDRGVWHGVRLLSEAWVERAFTPWNKSAPNLPSPNYGWFWWQYDFGPGWRAHVASGWKGQRIAVIPEQGMVVTMTGLIEDEEEHAFFARLMRRFIVPAVAPPSGSERELRELMEEVRRGSLKPGIERRMIPSSAPKERRRPYLGPKLSGRRSSANATAPGSFRAHRTCGRRRAGRDRSCAPYA
jgi:CubicO group peptidase (beta-lactamase class C family)